MQTNKPPKKAFGPVYLAVFIDLLGFGIILPALPFFAMRFDTSGLGLGALFAAYSIAQLFGAPLLGRLSDRIGRRPVLILSLFGSSVAFLWCGFATQYASLISARFFAGLFGGSISAAQAYIVDQTEPQERSKYLGMLGACIGMGFVFGPAIGAMMSAQGFSGVSFLSSGLAFANFLFALFFLPESRNKFQKLKSTARFDLTNFRMAMSYQKILLMLLATFLVSFAFVSLETTFALLGKQKFSLDSRKLGWIFASIGLSMVISQGALIRPLSKKFGEYKVALLGAFIMALALVFVPVAPKLTLSVAFVLLFAAGQGLWNPALSTLLSIHSSADKQGGILGLSQGLSAGSRAIAPVIAGYLFDIHWNVPYFLGSILVLSASFLLFKMNQAPSNTA